MKNRCHCGAWFADNGKDQFDPRLECSYCFNAYMQHLFSDASMGYDEDGEFAMARAFYNALQDVAEKQDVTKVKVNW